MKHESHEPYSPADGEPAHYEANLPASAGDTSDRCHGWTGFARRLFLEVLAETGRVSVACDYTRLTRQSAYALRARDPVFAASWDAACELARQPLADSLYEKALDGVTDTITRDGEVVATRHRFDSRLSIAVLQRLDKRCDRAAELGSHHLALVRNWDEWLKLVGKGAEAEAAALLESARAEPARHCQNCQIPLGQNPTGDSDVTLDDDEAIDLSDRCWRDEDGVWMTDFPPPPGFDGYDQGEPGSSDYRRECTDEEAELLDSGEAAAGAAERSHEEALRDAWFDLLRKEAHPPGGEPAEDDPGGDDPGGDDPAGEG